MEVVLPMDPCFHGNSSSPTYPSAPSSPKRFGCPSNSDFYYYTSAPASPTRGESTFDFALGFSGQLRNDRLSTELAAADELFEGGMIRPLNSSNTTQSYSTSSPLLSAKDQARAAGEESMDLRVERERGRSTTQYSSLSSNLSSSRRVARSLSPLRTAPITPACTAANPLTGGSSGSKKWRLKDLFLFRSASEGRATGGSSKDLLRKYSLLSPSNSSSNISHNGDQNNGSMRKGRGSGVFSAHEMHYTVNRAATEEMKKKTPLPFHRNSLFGYLRLNPAIHSISRRLNGCYSNQGNPKNSLI